MNPGGYASEDSTTETEEQIEIGPRWPLIILMCRYLLRFLFASERFLFNRIMQTINTAQYTRIALHHEMEYTLEE